VVKGPVRALEIEEIKNLAICFGQAARRCREAGFDFIELHGAHGYLINQFLAPNSNIRTDEYGGSFENRTRFLFEVIDAVKHIAGKDYPVGIRINGNDYIENGWELKDTLRIAPLLEKTGVAYIHVSGGVYGSTELTIPSMYTPQGCFIHMAEAVKQVVNVPVITVGRIKDPEMANAAIRDGKADMVALGRSIIADPEYPNKAKSGKASLIRPCVGCCLGCIHAVLAKEPGSCVVNPDVGREYKLAEEKAPEKSQKILVVGAGPSGLAAARMFAQRGHQVKILEKGSEQGGLLALAATAPGREELGDILRFFRNELERLGVAVDYNTPLSSEVLNFFDPDHVILATGSMPDMPVIKGLFKSKMKLITSVDVFTDAHSAGDRVIVLGGGFTGLITAHKLGDMGKEVVVLNRKKSFAEEMSSNDRYYLRERLKACGVVLYKMVTVKSFTDDGVSFTSKGEPVTLEGFDTVVISEKHQPVRDAKHLEKQSRAKFHMIGDAKTPRHLMFCVAEAEEAGRSI
jgi:NADPH-dependent 2,4-dienoyl-CoA reductase/sulfur reductase-like enzyme